jgi:hypothetical protein
MDYALDISLGLCLGDVVIVWLRVTTGTGGTLESFT